MLVHGTVFVIIIFCVHSCPTPGGMWDAVALNSAAKTILFHEQFLV